MKYIKLPAADAYKYPYRGYKDSNQYYKELKANKDQWLKLRKRLLAQQNFQCAYCLCDLHGRRMNIEHVQPLGRGGGNGGKNLVAACADCNKKKGNKQLTKIKLQELETNLKMLQRKSSSERRKYMESFITELEYQEELGNYFRRIFSE